MLSYQTSDELCAEVSRHSGGTAILAFSRGKDAVASWIQMRKHFDRIIPVWLYLVPGLEFESESIKYFEEAFGERIMHLPHPSLYRWINQATFQAPERLRTILDLNLPTYDFPDVWALVRNELGLGSEVLTGVGVRSADSIVRYASIKKRGAINWKKGEFFPIYDWKKERLIREIAESGIKLPVDYQWFGRSFDGLDARFLAPLRDHAPADYQRVLEWFPLADIDVFRREVMYATE